MKAALVGIVVVILMAASGGIGYYFGNDNGLKTAQSIRTEFINQRLNPQAQGTPNADSAANPGGGQRGGQGGAAAQTAQASGQFGAGAQFAGRALANGTVKSIQGNNITVTQQDGSTVVVTIDDKTQILKLATATSADVQAGLRITVTDANGTKRIQLTPAQ